MQNEENNSFKFSYHACIQFLIFKKSFVLSGTKLKNCWKFKRWLSATNILEMLEIEVIQTDNMI